MSVAPRPEPSHRAVVTRAWNASETLRGLAFVVDDEDFVHRHRQPGQYLLVRIGAAENFYALASEPGAPEPELLYKPDTGMTVELAKLVPGDELRVGPPEGKGFPVDAHYGRDLILCAAGTGVAPLRAVLRAIAPKRDQFGDITFFYGQRTPGHFAYQDELPGWRAAAIAIHLVESERGARIPDRVAAIRPRLDNAVAYLCGMKTMIADVGDLLTTLGLPKERIFLNY